MNISIYKIVNHGTIRVLNNLDHLLDMTVAFCDEKKIDESVILQARLSPDMFPFIRQIQLVSDMTKSCVARIVGAEPPKFEDTEISFKQLKERIARTIEYINSVSEMDFAGCENREIKLPWYPEIMSVEVFVLHHSLPNIYFHITTAYNIMRHNGIAVGKRDFVGKITTIE